MLRGLVIAAAALACATAANATHYVNYTAIGSGVLTGYKIDYLMGSTRTSVQSDVQVSFGVTVDLDPSFFPFSDGHTFVANLAPWYVDRAVFNGDAISASHTESVKGFNVDWNFITNDTGTGKFTMRYSLGGSSFIYDYFLSGVISDLIITDNAPFQRFSGGFQQVPEPASWALMLVGFGAIGATMRVRRKSVKVA